MGVPNTVYTLIDAHKLSLGIMNFLLTPWENINFLIDLNKVLQIFNFHLPRTPSSHENHIFTSLILFYKKCMVLVADAAI